MRSLLARVIMVVGLSLSSLYVCPAIPFWSEGFVLKDWLLSLWESPCVLFVAFPLLLLMFALCVLLLADVFKPWAASEREFPKLKVVQAQDASWPARRGPWGQVPPRLLGNAFSHTCLWLGVCLQDLSGQWGRCPCEATAGRAVRWGSQ